MEEETKEVETNYQEKLKQETERLIEQLMNDGIQSSNLDSLGKLVDIHKDVCNEEYWKEKIEMRYRGSNSYGNYGNYGTYGNESYNDGSYGRRSRDSRGRYTARGYRGHDTLGEMQDRYQEYSEGREQYRENGSYGAKQDTMKSLEYMLQSVEDFMMMLEEEASSQEEVEMIKKTARKISEM